MNPLNVLGTHPIAARDTLVLPSIVTGINDGPGLLGMFAQIKQEFVTARYFAWEGRVADNPHFSDRDTHLIDTLDYPVYGLAIEKVKVAYRMAYSLLDKCAYLMNKYFELNIPDSRVSFSRVWYINGNPDKGFNPRLMDTANGPLRGLYWLSRDLYEADTMGLSLQPEAQQLKDIRDHAEHKYLRVHEYRVEALARHPGLQDQYARSVTRDELVAKTTSILGLARSAISYLSLGIHVEEHIRRSKEPDRKVMPMPTHLVPDEWKR